jgi:hypothetical protein
MKTRAHTTRRPARPGLTSQRSQITGYLAGAVGTAALIGAPQAEAAVTAVNFGFGTEYTLSDGNAAWTVGPGFGTVFGLSETTRVSLGFGLLAFGYVYTANATSPIKFFDAGTVLGVGGQANGNVNSIGYFHHSTDPLRDLTSDQLNKNIGFQTTTGNWGWANVSWTEATKTLVINEAFVESVPFSTITIPYVPEPSRALLALAGLGGVALRRRRKQAA